MTRTSTKGKIERGISEIKSKDGTPRFLVKVQRWVIVEGRKRKIQRQRRARNISEARRVLDDLKRELGDVKSFVPRRTFAELLREYYSGPLTKKSPQAIYNEENALKTHVLPVLGDILISDITPHQISEIIENGLQGRSDQTKRHVRTYIKSVFKLAVLKGYIETNPVDSVAQIRVESKNQNYLTSAQVALLLEYARKTEHPWFYHYALAVYTSLRVNEQRGLFWSDILWDQDLIAVNRVFHPKHGFKYVPKNGQQRHVDLNPELKEILLELKRKDPPVSETSFLLPQLSEWKSIEHGKPLKQLLRYLGLPEIRYYDLRASLAMAVLENGGSLSVVRELLGHKNMSSVEHYLRRLGQNVKGTLAGISFKPQT